MQDSLLARVGEAVWGWPMMALFLGTGIWYMLRLRGLPLRRLGQALRAIFRGGESADGISPYAALCTALAATIGTGNIVGVATALAAGGPGALLWMMVAALFGMATQYAEGYLAVRYRRRQGGKWLGGPFCYIEQGLGWRWLAVTFAVVGAAVGLLGVGTVAQVNRLTTAYNTNNNQNSTFWLRNAAFLKLKNAEIGYSFKNMRIYVSGNNLLTFSKFKLWDPEMGGGSGMSYPTQRTFNVGFQMTIN